MGTLLFDQTLPVSLNQPMEQLTDLMIGLGPFSRTGNHLAAIPGTLSFSKTAGTIFARAFNHIPDPDNPHISTLGAQSPVQFGYNTQLNFSENIFGTVIDPASYDVGGVVTPVPGVVWTIQRVWAYPLNQVELQIRLQYGQNLYLSQSEALDAIGNTVYIPNPQGDMFAALLGHIVVRSDATDLSDPTQAAIRRAGKFDSP